MVRDVDMQDADAVADEKMMYGALDVTEAELNEKYPNRPHNIHKTLPFHVLHTTLFNPLNEIRKKPTATGPLVARRKTGQQGVPGMSPNDRRNNMIDRFIARWRQDVGNDVYPVFRLIVPEQDRDRAMYGLKEKLIAKILISIMGISKNSADAISLNDWKLPGQRSSTSGDFAGRCFEVLSKRPTRTSVGNLSIAQVNEMLDRLSLMSKEADQRVIFDDFYRNMNPEELTWLIRIILRQMKLGATEKTFFSRWHQDAESLFNVSSSLRRVCWELYDPNITLQTDQSQITLMQCFQPQLAGFQVPSLEKILVKMRPTEEDDEFWIEEKLDGERMQMHMMEDLSMPGGFRFGFWSRKAKDYTYLYGKGLEDDASSLTKYLKDAFTPNVRNIVLDGEMIAWDMEQDAMVPFGHLKTAAIGEIQNPFSNTRRPLYRIFDCLYLNDKAITPYTLRDRRAALKSSVKNVDRRFEIHDYTSATKVSEIEDQLRKVVQESSEGLVVKSPRSNYRLNDRNEDWIKVKPEYMNEFGEDIDCIIIGGYYGSGHRGGMLSSYLCGLKPQDRLRRPDDHEQLFWSFFKVGGGFTAGDYARVSYLTDGKWKKYDTNKPPKHIIELGGGDRQFERPDMWIMPTDSIVVSVKAASVHTTKQFRTGFTLRFPRFNKIREDRDWTNTLGTTDFIELKNRAETEHKEKEFKVDDERRKRRKGSGKRKREAVLMDNVHVKNAYGGPDSKIFEGLTFFVISGASTPTVRSKADIETIIKKHGGAIIQSHKGKTDLVVIGERSTLKVSSIMKEGKLNIVKPTWVFDCIEQTERDGDRPTYLLPFEPGHMHFTRELDVDMIAANVDEYGDSYCRDLTMDGLRKLCDSIKSSDNVLSRDEFFSQLDEHGVEIEEKPGNMFRRITALFDSLDSDMELSYAKQIVEFANGKVAKSLDDKTITHIVVGKDRSRLDHIRTVLSARKQIPRIVTIGWVTDSWDEKTLLDAERFAP